MEFPKGTPFGARVWGGGSPKVLSSLGKFEIPGAERSGWAGRPRRGKGARISGLTNERSGVTGLEISKGAHLGGSQVSPCLAA